MSSKLSPLSQLPLPLTENPTIEVNGFFFSKLSRSFFLDITFLYSINSFLELTVFSLLSFFLLVKIEILLFDKTDSSRGLEGMS